MKRSVVFIFALAGCGADGTTQQSNLLAGFKVPAKPANGIQIILPIVRALEPGTDNEICSWTDQIADHDLDVKAVQGFQAPGGHHVIIFSTKDFKQPGTQRVCTDDDMATFRFAAGAGGEGTDDINMAPGDLVYRIPKGSQIVLNHHYINATSKPLDSQSAMNIMFADPAAKNIPSSSLAIVNTNLKLAPGPNTMDINCTMTEDVNAWYFIPHMHEWGTHIVIDRTLNGKTETFFDLNWQKEYTFHPPTMRTDPSMPFTFHKGDPIHVQCHWENTSGRDLTFGLEMCVAFAAHVDTRGIGNLACDGGKWTDF